MLGSDVLIIHSWPMVSSHDFGVLTYVEESDWTTCTRFPAVIGRSLCVVHCHWSVVPGLIKSALAEGEAYCQSFLAVLRARISRRCFRS